SRPAAPGRSPTTRTTRTAPTSRSGWRSWWTGSGCARAPRSLEAWPARGDALGVEAEPVHAADVPRVLDLEAPVHHHGDATLLGDPGALGVDHAELAPQRVRADRHGVAGDLGERVRGAEHVDDVHVDGHVAQAR